jgi:hypothetical protein
MDSPIKEIPLANGLVIRFFNRTSHYYGDFYRVKLEINCEIPVRAEYFANEDALAEAMAIFGKPLVYGRSVEQMGVPSTEIDRVLSRLMAFFEEHSLSYFATASFPQKYVLTELAKVKRKRGRLPAGYSGSDA